jgi:hypothetical protein
MERRLGNDPAMTLSDRRMSKFACAIIGAALLAAIGASTSRAQDLGVRPLRYGTTSGWYYDNRDDNRDFTGNGFFPGNFTADPPSAWLGAAGALAGNSYRQPAPYPSQVVIGAQPPQATCGRSGHTRHRTFVGSDGVRHRC